MTNINKQVWDYIDNRIEIKKTLLNGLINTSALARKIAKEKKLEQNIDAIISAIRRYETQPEKREQYINFYKVLKRAKISSKTKLSSILIRRNDSSENKLASIFLVIVGFSPQVSNELMWVLEWY